MCLSPPAAPTDGPRLACCWWWPASLWRCCCCCCCLTPQPRLRLPPLLDPPPEAATALLDPPPSSSRPAGSSSSSISICDLPFHPPKLTRESPGAALRGLKPPPRTRRHVPAHRCHPLTPSAAACAGVQCSACRASVKRPRCCLSPCRVPSAPFWRSCR